MPKPQSNPKSSGSNQGKKPIYPLPKDLVDILNEKEVSNPVLALNFFVRWESKWKVAKDASLQAAMSAIQKIKQYSDEYCKRLNNQLIALNKQGYVTESFRLKTESRLIVGLGAKGALEIGITLHHLYGFPYIPASALKGICRGYAEQIEDAKGDCLKRIFGSSTKDEKKESEKQLGKVVFLDAIPSSPVLEKDIMNPHYSEYYAQKKVPGDWYNPVPIFFLAVPSGTEFWFGLAADTKENLDTAKNWLIGGLSELGAGAKTSSGYGFFSTNTGNSQTQTVAKSEVKSAPNPIENVTSQTPPQETAKQKPKGVVRAVIINDQSKPPKVKILEGDYADKETIMPGVNLAGLNLKKGDEVYVEPILSRDKKRLEKVEHKRID